jgi:hypothetical protein
MTKRSIPLLALALFAAHAASADSIYTFTMDTMPLVGNGPFALDLQFLDGSGTGDNNNTVTLTNFGLGGGSPSGSGTATGGASGSLASGVTLQDTSFFNEYYENFTPGTLLSFTIDTTNVLDAGGAPDLFTVAILDSGLNELPTNGPASEFLDVSLAGGANAQVSTYGSAPGSEFSLAGPIVQLQSPSPVPEPSSFGELIAVLLAAGVGHTVFKPRRLGAKDKIR